MTAVIEAGPGTIRRLACADPPGADPETVAAALHAVDDPAALVGEQPVCVDALWRTVLRALCSAGQTAEPVVIVHPSWWAASRVARVRTAARTVAGDVTTCGRDKVLATAAPEPNVVVEIAPRMVVVTGTAVVAEPRTNDPHRVAAAVVRRIVAATASASALVLIDKPSTVGGAVALAALIAAGLRAVAADMAVQVVDDARLARLAGAALDTDHKEPETVRGHHRHRGVVPAALALTAVLAGVGLCGRPDAPTVEPATYLVEGRITLRVPAQWPVQRVTSGPGSARVVLTSPSDPQVALHVTQSPVPDAGLSVTAAALERALADQPPGVFVDFNPAGQRAGRPAVTYREVRAGHDIWWSIVLDDAVRISIGCQSRPGDADAVREVCEQAVRSAHRLG